MGEVIGPEVLEKRRQAAEERKFWQLAEWFFETNDREEIKRRMTEMFERNKKFLTANIEPFAG